MNSVFCNFVFPRNALTFIDVLSICNFHRCHLLKKILDIEDDDQADCHNGECYAWYIICGSTMEDIAASTQAPAEEKKDHDIDFDHFDMAVQSKSWCTSLANRILLYIHHNSLRVGYVGGHAYEFANCVK